MGPIACKFGGTSVADAGQVRKVVSIVRSDPRRRYVVVSAPGKRSAMDEKITDMLYECHRTAEEGGDIQSRFAPVRERYEDVARELGVEGVSQWLDEVEDELLHGAS